MRLRSFSAKALALSTLLLAPAAFADAPAPSLVRLLSSAGGRANALADASGRVPVAVAIPKGSSAASLGLLPVAPGVGAIRLSPEMLPIFAAAHPTLGLFVGPPRHTLLDVSKVWTNARVYRKTSGEDGTGVVVGIIDTGLDVAHADFRNQDGSTRVAWLLRGGVPRGVHAELETAFGCTDPAQSACAIFSADDINSMLAVPGGHALNDLEGHGTHVTSIAAGNGGVMTTDTPKYVGMAPGATIIVAAPSSPGAGFYDPDILNSARFIFDRAEALGMPCVINLSIGGDFGPHDGTSLLEKGLAALVGEDKPGRAIVVAAGNSGSLYDLHDGKGPYGIHTEAHSSDFGDARVPILTPASKSGQGFVWITFQPDDDVSVGLDGPGGETWIALTDPGDERGYEGSDGTTGAVINRLVNDKSSLNAETNGAVVAWDGAWDEGEFAIVLRGRGTAQLWVVGQGDVGLESGSGLLFAKALRQGTINVPASDPGLLAVGCTLNRLSWTPYQGSALQLTSLGGELSPPPDSSCYFSSAGPTPLGVMKPDLAAPGGFVAGAMSLDADPRTALGSMFDPPGCPDETKCYVVDDRHAITSGSSMSSPHVAGAVALLFQHDRTLTQRGVTEILQAGAQYPTGRVVTQTQIGPGELDMMGARRVLLGKSEADTDPDLSKSWYSLSSDVARPDPSWPIHGTIQLRESSREVATGVSGSKLGLWVTNGTVVEPIEEVRPGMFRFAVAGERGTGGKTMSIEVAYDGVSLCEAPSDEACGPRTLPIGSDAWAAAGEFGAVGGGCACRSSGPSPQGSWPVGFAALLGLGLALRRSRS